MKEAQLKYTRFNYWVWHYLPPCKEIVKLITAAEDGKLSLWKRLIMKIHIRACASCENFLNQLKFLRRAVRTGDEKLLTEEDTSVKLSDEARERIKNKLKSSTLAL
jgi:DNA-binding FrmR family transcriptional regulator